MPEHSQQIRLVAAALPLLLLVGCAGGPKPLSHAGPGSTALPTLCLNQTPINDVGLTDAERSQLYQSAAARGRQCYAAWIANLNPSTLPYSTLPHSGLMAHYLPPDSSLSQAKADATLVVSGTISSTVPQSAPFGTNVTIAVTQVFKGQAGNTITIHQLSHLEPQDNWQSVLIVDAGDAPLLLPGDSVFLFLKSSPQGLYQESYTGTYYVRVGQIHALELNPFASQVNGKSPADFAAAITNG